MEQTAAPVTIADPALEQLLHDFYTDLILVERRAELTAQTYQFSAEEFLKWVEEQKRDLPSLTTQEPPSIIIWPWRHTNAVSGTYHCKRHFATGGLLAVIWKAEKTSGQKILALELDRRPKASKSKLPRGN